MDQVTLLIIFMYETLIELNPKLYTKSHMDAKSKEENLKKKDPVHYNCKKKKLLKKSSKFQ
jgi:hypothetical protein